MKSKIFFISILFLTIGCTSREGDFFQDAFGEPSTEIKILSYHKEVTDNFFKNEYAWLLDVSGEMNWVNRVSLTELSISNKTDEGFYKAKYLSAKFPNAFSTQDTKRLYFIKQTESGRSHYLLKTEQGNNAIYYISTI